MANYLIITGGSKGIGEKTIAHFKKEQWQVINISRSASTLSDVHFSIDLSSIEDIQKHTSILRDAIKNPKRICLVHNAAFCKRDSVDSLSLEDLKLTLETNVIAPAALNQVFIPLMQQGSSIIYIGSTLAEIGVPGKASYITSKHALVGLMRATCQDLADKMIRTCCICPGLVETKMLVETMDEKTKQNLLNKTIGKRLIKPEEIAEMIYFCANTDTINGITLHANLGQIAD